ncbi:MAG: hypothetical protein R3C44_15870 [Chloroflexota bacterium]
MRQQFTIEPGHVTGNHQYMRITRLLKGSVDTPQRSMVREGVAEHRQAQVSVIGGFVGDQNGLLPQPADAIQNALY